MMYYSNDYLCHYGVLGMKWGQHLFGGNSVSSSSRKVRTNKSSKTSNSNSVGNRLKTSVKNATDWAYAHRKQIAIGVGVVAAVAVTAAVASPYVSLGAQAAKSAFTGYIGNAGTGKSGVSTDKYVNGKLVKSTLSANKNVNVTKKLTDAQKKVMDAYSKGNVSKEYYENYMKNTGKTSYFE